jgi:hypothetical protein
MGGRIACGPWKPSRRSVTTSVSRWAGSAGSSGWIGVLSWITRASSSSSTLQGSLSVKRTPCGPRMSNTRVSPPFTLWRPPGTRPRGRRRRGARLRVWGGRCRRWCRCERRGLRQTSGQPRASRRRPGQRLQQRDQRRSDTSAGARGSNQRSMPPCSALYSTGCQCARCNTASTRSPSTTKQPWRRRRYRPPSRRYRSGGRSSQKQPVGGADQWANRATDASSTAKPVRPSGRQVGQVRNRGRR